MKLLTKSISFLISLLALTSKVDAAPFSKTQVLEAQYLSLGSTYYPHVLAEHQARQSLVRRVGQSPNLDLRSEFGPYLTPTLYNTIVFYLYPDGTVSAEILDPNNHTQFLSVAGTYVRRGRNLTIDLDDQGLGIHTDFVGKASKDSKKCYQGTSESPQQDFPGSFWVTYWEGCRQRAN